MRSNSAVIPPGSIRSRSRRRISIRGSAIASSPGLIARRTTIEFSYRNNWLRSDLRVTRPIDRLIAIMASLRDPARGCPWDKEQDFATIAPYTIEEAYEVADAIERADMAALKDDV